MKSKQCTSLPESAVESSQTSFWDIDPSLQSSGINTLAKSSENESKMDGLKECQCGKAMSSCSIHPNTKDEWIASMRDSLAKILVSPETRQGLAKIHALDFTEKFYALQMKYSLRTSSWKMSQQSLLDVMGNGSEQSLVILPREAMMQSGYVYPLPKLVLGTREIDGGSWVTPTAASSQSASMKASLKEAKRLHPKGQNHLAAQVASVMFPTSTANEDAAGTPNGKMQRQLANCTEVRGETPEEWASGTLNPMWVEWLMGFPIKHTDLKD
jgi:hypothetical protein